MRKILITGLGTSGKTTYRRRLVKSQKARGFKVSFHDADAFTESRHPDDVGDVVLVDDVACVDAYIVEDVRALSGSVDCYDEIVYVMPESFCEHAKMILSRAKRWFELGRFDWMRESGWKGTGQPNDWRNVLPIAKIVIVRLWSTKKRYRKDLRALADKPCRFVRSRLGQDGVEFDSEP